MTPNDSPAANKTSEVVEKNLAWLQTRGGEASNFVPVTCKEFKAIADRCQLLEKNLSIACDLLDASRLHTDAAGLRNAISFDPLND